MERRHSEHIANRVWTGCSHRNQIRNWQVHRRRKTVKGVNRKSNSLTSPFRLPPPSLSFTIKKTTKPKLTTTKCFLEGNRNSKQFCWPRIKTSGIWGDPSLVSNSPLLYRKACKSIKPNCPFWNLNRQLGVRKGRESKINITANTEENKT